MKEVTRKELIMACQHAVKKAKLDYRDGRMSLETLQEVAKSVKVVEININIAFDKVKAEQEEREVDKYFDHLEVDK